MLNWIKTKLHIHLFTLPVVSKYVSFHQRDIVYQCRCGKKKLDRVYKQFGESFPIETASLITNYEVNKILNNPAVLQTLSYGDRLNMMCD